MRPTWPALFLRLLQNRSPGQPRQNLLFAFIYNGVGVPIAARVMYPFTG